VTTYVQGVVRDAGGGEVTVTVDRTTLDYPPVGTSVAVVPAADYAYLREVTTLFPPCGARNPNAEPEHHGRCIRQARHTGKHDDMFRPPWGDPYATAEQNRADAAELDP
jgi:hypothetical protein